MTATTDRPWWADDQQIRDWIASGACKCRGCQRARAWLAQDEAGEAVTPDERPKTCPRCGTRCRLLFSLDNGPDLCVACIDFLINQPRRKGSRR